MSNPPVRPLLTISLLLFLLVTQGCSPPAKPKSKKDTAKQDDSDSPAVESKPVSPPTTESASGTKITAADREALAALGEAYAKAMSGGDDAVARAPWNAEALMDASMGEAAKAAPDAASQMKRGFIDALDRKPGGVMWATYQQPWRMLRVHEIDGEVRILFRVAADSAITYLDFIPRPNADGEIEFVDAYVFASGELLSQTFGRIFIPQLADAAKTPIAKLLSTQDPMVKHAALFVALSKSVQAGNYGQTLEQYRALPPEIQDNKSVLLMYLGACGKLMAAGEDPQVEQAYREGVEKFQKLFGDDPAFLLMGIDYYFYQQDYDAAIEAIDKLDKSVGGDPYLDFFRASVMLSQEKFKEALPFAQRAADSNPELEDPHWGIVNVQLSLGNFEAVAEGLDLLAEKFDYEFVPEEDPAYEEFRASAAGKAWIEKHAAESGNN